MASTRPLRCVSFAWLISIAVGFIAADATADQAGRLPVPSTSDVADAVSIIQQAFEDDYKSAKESGNARPLIEKLVASVAETENPARKYAMLVEAERLAVESDAHQLALEVTDVRAEQFAIDGLKTRCEILSTMGTASPQAAAEVLDNATAMAKEAIQADRFDVATAAADLAVEVAKAIDKDEKKKGLEIRRKSKGKEQIPEPVGPRLVEQSETLRKQVGESQDLHKEFLAAGKTLEASPDDPSANTVAGKFLCFVKRDWEVGLKLLTKGTESELKGLANRECSALARPDGLAVDTFEPAAFLPVANAWWKLAEGDALRSESEQAAARAHAADLYDRMLPKISDPVDIKLAEKRIAAVQEADSSSAAVVDGKKNASGAGPLSGLSDLLDDDAPKASESKGRSRRLRRMTVPRDAIRFQGHSYYFFTVQCSAQEAAQQCDNAGGHLARIGSDEEYDMIMKVLQTVRQLQREGEMRAWIDGSDKAAEGQWVYTDGTPMTYFRWGPGEPNNSDNEDSIVLLLRDDFQAMNDLSEGHRAGFVCEWER